MNVLSATVDYNSKLSFLEALEFGGQTVLIGMLAIFAVLGLIWALLTVFKMVFTNFKEKEKAPKEIQEPVQAVTPTHATSENEIVAVIAAAIAMAESESGDGLKFRVVSFRKK